MFTARTEYICYSLVTRLIMNIIQSIILYLMDR